MAPPESDAIHFSVHQESVVGRSTSDPLPERSDLTVSQVAEEQLSKKPRKLTPQIFSKLNIPSLLVGVVDPMAGSGPSCTAAAATSTAPYCRV